jgi:hypothetical protein
LVSTSILEVVGADSLEEDSEESLEEEELEDEEDAFFEDEFLAWVTVLGWYSSTICLNDTVSVEFAFIPDSFSSLLQTSSRPRTER